MITAFYAAPLGLMLLWLSLEVIKTRYKTKVSIGDNDDPILRRRMRVQANFCEYTPMCLLLIGFAELSGAWGWLVHLLGLTLVIGRGIHAYGFGQEADSLNLRRIGMMMTFLVLGLASITAFFASF